MNTNKLPARHKGFTLIELMVVLTVLGVMMAFAVPNFREARRNAGLTDTVNTLVSSVYRTRTEAMKDGVPVVLMPCNDDCTSTGTDWQKGWVIFADRNGNGAYNANTSDDPANAGYNDGPLVFTQRGDVIPDYIAISVGNGGAVKFSGTGFPASIGGGSVGDLTITVSRTDRPNDNRYVRRIVLSKSGRVRTCRPDRDSNCSAGTSTGGGGGGGGSDSGNT
ncbi:MAG: GspH/FimT family pseudopilin [Ottowia sp.]|nr:GspH/FimT family pseudopilin [Ottowia sp.]